MSNTLSVAVADGPKVFDISAHAGIHLDVACGRNKQPGYVGMDIQPFSGVDIVHDINVFPWPLPDDCVRIAVLSHIVEHISPINFHFVHFMNELWRVMRVGGVANIVCPHGRSNGYLQDPTHCNAMNGTTFAYFDPIANVEGAAPWLYWQFYTPRPWKIEYLHEEEWANIEVALRKRPVSDLDELPEEVLQWVRL